MFKKYIHDPIYGKNFWLLVADREEASAYIKKKYQADISFAGETGCHFILEKDNVIDAFIWLRPFFWTIPEQGVAAHEICHHVIRAFATCQIPIEEKTTEVFAYYYEYIYGQVWLALKKFHPKQKKKTGKS